MQSREEWLAFYAERGLATIPLRPREKRPLRTGWQTPDPNAWVDAPSDANIGVLCGPASGGLLVLDFDTREGPREILGMSPEELAAHTLVVRTARGWHVYARDSSARTQKACAGLDLRAEGAQVVAPPSIHPSGIAYEFVNRGAEIATLQLLPLPAGDPVEPHEVDWARAEHWIALQSPKLGEAWRRLKAADAKFDRSSADFAVARCLWEGGFSSQEIVQVRLALPGSKSRERGRQYATRTVAQASRASVRSSP